MTLKMSAFQEGAVGAGGAATLSGKHGPSLLPAATSTRSAGHFQQAHCRLPQPLLLQEHSPVSALTSTQPQTKCPSRWRPQPPICSMDATS